MLVHGLQHETLQEQGLLGILVDGAGSLVIKVLDMQGRFAKSCQEMIVGKEKISIDLQDLPTGQYVLNAFSGGNFLKCFRFVKP